MDITLNDFTGDEINYQLQQILSSPAFRNSPTLSRFLTYIIAEALVGREQYIKEYSIALNVLNRPHNFNPQDDAVVRIHAGRLRRALSDYYLIQGINDPIIIHIPKGAYVPLFEIGNTENHPRMINASEQVINPIVAVFPFRAIPENTETKSFSMILSEQLSAELSRFQDISVIGYYDSETLVMIKQNIMEAARFLRADYIITGSIQSTDHGLRVLINLLVAATGEVMLMKSFEREGPITDIFEIQNDMMQSVVRVVGGYHGMIHQEMIKTRKTKVPDHPGIRQAQFLYSKFKRSYSAINYHAALTTLQGIVKEDPNHAVLWAMLAELYLDGITLGITDNDKQLSLAYQAVLYSFTIDPDCQHAWCALACVHLLKKEKEACLQSARQCIQLNPQNATQVAAAGFILICAGYLDTGFPIMEKAMESALYDPFWINTGAALYFLGKKEFSTVLFWSEKVNGEETFWDPLLKCVALSYLNREEEAQKFLLKLLTMERETPRTVLTMVATVLLSEDLIDIIMEGLNRIGFHEAFNSDMKSVV